MAAAVVGLAMLTAACTSATAGQPEPTKTTSTSTSESSPDESSTSTGGDSEYSLAKLCELITPEEAQQLGGSAQGEEGHSVSDGHTVCQWSDATTMVVGAQDGMTAANAETGPGITNTPTSIDGLTAVQSLKTEPIVICQVLVELPSGKLFTSAVSVLSAGEGKYDACQVATQLSNLIIPRVKDQ
jgi:Protein of unknown function (DUF3558)